ncbi:conserved hypothetical protein [Candidatus Terasakiella magnetica]|nr:conserved hypothetical protein [Candidatus Terasakiella magnetica]
MAFGRAGKARREDGAWRRAFGALAVLALLLQGLGIATHTASAIAAEAPLFLSMDSALCSSTVGAKAAAATGAETALHCQTCYTVQAAVTLAEPVQTGPLLVMPLAVYPARPEAAPLRSPRTFTSAPRAPPATA